MGADDSQFLGQVRWDDGKVCLLQVRVDGVEPAGQVDSAGVALGVVHEGPLAVVGGVVGGPADTLGHRQDHHAGQTIDEEGLHLGSCCRHLLRFALWIMFWGGWL